MSHDLSEFPRTLARPSKRGLTVLAAYPLLVLIVAVSFGVTTAAPVLGLVAGAVMMAILWQVQRTYATRSVTALDASHLRVERFLSPTTVLALGSKSILRRSRNRPGSDLELTDDTGTKATFTTVGIDGVADVIEYCRSVSGMTVEL